jgi:hypothetical protein
VRVRWPSIPSTSICSILILCDLWSSLPDSKCLIVHTPGRLDAELVRDAAIRGEVSLDSFLQRVLVTERALGWPFQMFLAEYGLSSHMWMAARRHG